MLHHSRRLTIIDDASHLDDELFGVQTELLERGRLDALQDAYNGAASQACGFHELAYQVIFYVAAHGFPYVDGATLALRHR